MRIALLAPLAEAVPPRLYGGTERVVHWLTEGLLARGHEVTLFASGDSRTRARLVPVVERALRLDPSDLREDVALHLLEAELCRLAVDEFDVVHSHIDYLAFNVLRGLPACTVTTLHGRLDLDGLAALYEHHDGALVSISDAQRVALPRARWVATVHHGLMLDDYRFAPAGGSFLLFLGRMSPEKRPDVAIRVARRAGIPIVLAAKLEPQQRAYFDDAVAPLLREPGVDFIGEVDDARKVDLLGQARALLFPVLWPEPFGLAMIEAMACGTPVVARRCGSIPEVVEDGVTGFVCDDDDQLVEAVARAHEIDRAACRRSVEQRFSNGRMAADYEALYDSLLAASAHNGRDDSLAHRHHDGARPFEDVDTHIRGVSPHPEIDLTGSDPYGT